MKSLSDRQASIVMVSDWLGARTNGRDLPRNMREIGDSAEFAYSYPSMHQQRQAQ